jgi:hypothetical protein
VPWAALEHRQQVVDSPWGRIAVDADLVELLAAIWSHGWTTRFSCQGGPPTTPDAIAYAEEAWLELEPFGLTRKQTEREGYLVLPHRQHMHALLASVLGLFTPVVDRLYASPGTVRLEASETAYVLRFVFSDRETLLQAIETPTSEYSSIADQWLQVAEDYEQRWRAQATVVEHPHGTVLTVTGHVVAKSMPG